MANKQVVALLLLVCFVVAEAKWEYVQPPPQFKGKQIRCYESCYNNCVWPASFCKPWCGVGCIYPIMEDSLDDDESKFPHPRQRDYDAFLKTGKLTSTQYSAPATKSN